MEMKFFRCKRCGARMHQTGFELSKDLKHSIRTLKCYNCGREIKIKI